MCTGCDVRMFRRVRSSTLVQAVQEFRRLGGNGVPLLGSMFRNWPFLRTVGSQLLYFVLHNTCFCCFASVLRPARPAEVFLFEEDGEELVGLETRCHRFGVARAAPGIKGVRMPQPALQNSDLPCPGQHSDR